MYLKELKVSKADQTNKQKNISSLKAALKMKASGTRRGHGKVTWEEMSLAELCLCPKTESDGKGQTELVVCVAQKSSHAPLSSSTLSACLGRRWLSHINPS